MRSQKTSRIKAAMLAASASVAAVGMSEAATIAVNFLGDGYGALGSVVTADAYGVATADWTNQDVGDGAGSTTISSVSFAWTANNDWNAGFTPTTGNEEVEVGYVDDTGNNGSLTITGLNAWLVAEGAPSYTIQLVQGSDNATAFTDTAVSDSDGGTALGTFTNAAAGGGGALGGATNVLGLSSDTLFLEPGDRAGSARGTISGVIITSVPEPSSAALLGLGGLALIRRRRK